MRERLADESVDCVVTSPPYYGLRRYLPEGSVHEIGCEETVDGYIESLVSSFAEVKRVLIPIGTLWIVIGDSYGAGGGKQVVQTKNASHGLAGTRHKTPGIAAKQLIGVPWRLAFALQRAGWYLRCDVIWNKPNAFPSSVKDRPTRAHEYVFMLTKNAKYYYDWKSVLEPGSGKGWNGSKFTSEQDVATKPELGLGPRNETVDTRNRRSVWNVNTVASRRTGGQVAQVSHFAQFPPALVEPCILAGCPPGGITLDPFAGAGTTGLVALRHGRNFIGIDLNAEYCEMARERINEDVSERRQRV
jgi:site-specific DNA-methyltransferase (adenine-specific)